jgi:DNA (cytosine-5)-methyltransferase 1
MTALRKFQPIDGDIDVVDLFCGAGGSSLGLTGAGMKLRLAANHWARAIETHAANFRDADHLCEDINRYDMRNLPRTPVLWASPICFPAGTTVLTRRGPVPIETVTVGEEVLTHAGRWRPVTRVMTNVSDTVVVKGLGHNELETTAEHPFFARRLGRTWDNATRDYRKQLGNQEWVEAKNLDSHAWATPVNFGEPMAVPQVPGRGMAFTEQFWWMVGRWVGDGYVRIKHGQADPLPAIPRRCSQPAGSACAVCGQPARPDGRSGTGRVSPYCGAMCKSSNKRRKPTVRRHDIYIACGDHEAEDLGQVLAAVAPASRATARAGAGELRWRRSHPSTATVFETNHAGLATWLVEHFGRHAHGKRIPAWALTMPATWRHALLEGYISADGNHNNRMVRCSTVSRPLAVGVRLLAVSLGHGASIYAPSRRSVATIQGRQVRMRPAWSVGWTEAPDPKRIQSLDDDLHRWAKVRSVQPGRTQVQVFNLSVAEDESYIADGIVVHNCTEVSPAGGRSGGRRPRGQGDLFEEDGHVEQGGFERTRATFHDVIRATEVHRYLAVLVENVVEVAHQWELFDWWVDGMLRLGYRVQIVCVSAAHVGGEDNPHAPQWRDRLYLVFTREGVPLPNVGPRPTAFCTVCAADVAAVQSWKPGVKRVAGQPIGKYRTQYRYVCPNQACRHQPVEPYVLPAAAAIDWANIGERIGDRKRPLAPSTVRRIKAGLEMFAQPTMVTVNHGDDDPRAYPAAAAPLPTRTVKIGDGVACPPMLVPSGGTWRTDATTAGEPMPTLTTRETDAVVVPPPFLTLLRSGRDRTIGADEPLATIVADGSNHMLVEPEPFVTVLRRNADGASVRRPLPTVTAAGNHLWLTTPPGAFYVKNFSSTTGDAHLVKSVNGPLGAITTSDHHGLVIPYYRTGRAKTTREPLDTLTTRDRFGFIPDAAVDIDDCHYRMLQPREHLRAQRFFDWYLVTGNKGEQTMQAGNAVASNVAQWIGQQVMAVLNGTAA